MNRVIREVCAYRIHKDDWVARYDILCGGIQLGCDFQYRWLPSRKLRVDAWLKENRKAARDFLDTSLKDKGLSWKDVQRLPIPGGAYRARYV